MKDQTAENERLTEQLATLEGELLNLRQRYADAPRLIGVDVERHASCAVAQRRLRHGVHGDDHRITHIAVALRNIHPKRTCCTDVQRWAYRAGTPSVGGSG